MRRTLDWEPFYEVAAQDLSYEEKLDRYAKIAEERLEAARFEEFCAKNLGHLDQVGSIGIGCRLLTLFHSGRLPPMLLGLEPFAEFACAVSVHCLPDC